MEGSDPSDITYSRIDQIKGGELVLSLNEETGKLEPQPIKGLLDMGVQPVYKLTTEDGKTIRTTGNHPYLAKQESLVPTSKDQSPGNDSQSESNDDKIDIRFHNSLFSPQKEIPHKNEGNTAYNRSEQISISNVPFNHDFPPLANSNEKTVNKTAIAIDIPKVNIKSLTFLGRTNSGEIAPAENQATAILPAISEARSSWPTEKFFIKNNYSIINNHYVKWTKVIYLSPGDEIAVQNGETIAWQKIASIEYVGKEQVWDIEVANTHNFVANGIIAHNTYISGNVGIGTTNPLAALEIGGSGNVRVGGLTASSAVYTDVNKQLTSTAPGSGTLGYWTRSGTTLWPTTNTDNVTTLGNVGIGTTNPVGILHVGIGATPAFV
ncbi:hypothetical protein L6272_06155, partial [Microgenomates group bacterium]|nr:hypothetical protein [Microgenomates group bacterium]